jgi:hypothetical protein
LLQAVRFDVLSDHVDQFSAEFVDLSLHGIILNRIPHAIESLFAHLTSFNANSIAAMSRFDVRCVFF